MKASLLADLYSFTDGSTIRPMSNKSMSNWNSTQNLACYQTADLNSQSLLQRQL